jgi:hypothetical protein
MLGKHARTWFNCIVNRYVTEAPLHRCSNALLTGRLDIGAAGISGLGHFIHHTIAVERV